MTEFNSSEAWWRTQRGAGPIIATAIHDGHTLRSEVAEAMALSEEGRLREEDPFTGQAVASNPTHVIGIRSRFEFDLNRGEENAVYRTPEHSWGLKVWHKEPADDLVERSLDIHRAFYRMMGSLLDDVARDHPRFVLLDVHSYNHRRDGPDGPPTSPEDAPEINIGTSSMPREFWAPVLEPVMEAMRNFDFNGRRLDVRENIAFQGKGALTKFVHDNYPETGCAIAIEFKKFYMDEWTGEPNKQDLGAMRGLIECAAAAAEKALK
ncbi:N-formylglutamate amidohydrolase [Qipengyuania marisflavi]|uniref:N-formylglutamate amidohydrolase n=1 Tax=Qipengyuania marisflavi TaxID=2486356 RepID=A0A5S3P0S0_9SPHN|nr:N-formylglutamate amidohydrolase [Qipengyuania marisflavi]TMM46259.1 N-formylglutamate amidohydrolase [Qipengyuania marisflavi]